MSSSSPSSTARAPRIIAWSSASSTRITATGPVGTQAVTGSRRLPGSTSSPPPAAQSRSRSPSSPPAGRGARGRARPTPSPTPSSATVSRNRPSTSVTSTRQRARARVAQHVGHALAHDPGQRSAAAAEPGGPRAPWPGSRPRRARVRAPSSSSAQGRADGIASTVSRMRPAPAGRRARCRRRVRPPRRGPCGASRRTGGLDHHHRQRVPEQVVQVAGEALALLGDGDLGELRASTPELSHRASSAVKAAFATPASSTTKPSAPSSSRDAPAPDSVHAEPRAAAVTAPTATGVRSATAAHIDTSTHAGCQGGQVSVPAATTAARPATARADLRVGRGQLARTADRPRRRPPA